MPPDLEILCVDRIVFNLNTPNIVLDEQITWNNNINIKAKVPLQRNIPGFVNFLIGDHSRIDTMDWPKIDEQSGYELYILGTGTYTNYRAMGTLTISREQELISQQADNQSLNQTNYNVLASSLPQCTKVHVAVQSNQPVGFNPLKYGGPWPEGSVDIIKLSFPSTMKTSTNRSNFHSVTLLLAHGTNLTNHLNLGPQLESLFGYHCDCESGMRTNASCCHVQAACIALFCPTMFRSAKKNVARLNDIRRPELQRPISSGPPANNRSRCLFISPNPIRRSRDSRRNSRNIYLRNFQSFTRSTNNRHASSSNTSRLNSSSSVSSSNSSSFNMSTTAQLRSLRPISSQSQSQPRQSLSSSSINHPSGQGNLLNIQNTCYAAVVLQGSLSIELHLNIEMSNRAINHQNLDATLVQLCMQRDNPSNGPFSVVPLVTSVNSCLSQQNQFVLGRQQCAAEFFSILLEHLVLKAGFMSILYEQGNCINCGLYNMQLSQSPYIVDIPVPRQVPPCDISPLLQALLNTQVAGLTCEASGPCQGQPVPATLAVQPGSCFIIHLNRNAGRTGKILTPITEPADDTHWPGKTLLAIIAHEGRNVQAGHWIFFIKNVGIWLKLDSINSHMITIENPFDVQINSSDLTPSHNCTIDILIFK